MDSDQIFALDTNILEPNPLQPRGLITQESLAELAASVREHGILEPIVVAKTPAGFQIIAGERRWRAAKLIGLQQVPVVIRETSPQGMLEMAIVENVQRQDLNPLERAQAYRKLMDEFGLTNSEISQRVGKSPAYVSNTIRLLTLPDALKDALMSGQTSEGHARALTALEDSRLIVITYAEVLKKNLSVRGTEELVRRLRSRHGMLPRQGTRVDTAHILNEEVERIQDGLSEMFAKVDNGAAVKYVLTASQAKLDIKLPGNPDKTAAIVRKINEALTSYFVDSI